MQIAYLILTVLCLFAFLRPVYASDPAAVYLGDMQSVLADDDDTLVHLARDHGLGFVEMRSANPHVDPWLPGKGTGIKLPTRHLLPDAPHEGIVINLSEMRLYYFDKDKAPASYPLGVGREGLETPVGSTKIVRKKDGPSWRPTARMRRENPELPAVVGPGSQNPLGDYALYLGWPSYAIHGTNRPFGIGRRVSSGCIRLYPEDIEELFAKVSVGTPVHVVDQPIKVGWIKDVLYLEAHADTMQAQEIESYGVINTHSLESDDLKRILKMAGDDSEQIDWLKVQDVIQTRTGYPVAIAKRKVAKDSAQIEPGAGEEVISSQGAKTRAVSKKMSKKEGMSADEARLDRLINEFDPKLY